MIHNEFTRLTHGSAEIRAEAFDRILSHPMFAKTADQTTRYLFKHFRQHITQYDTWNDATRFHFKGLAGVIRRGFGSD